MERRNLCHEYRNSTCGTRVAHVWACVFKTARITCERQSNGLQNNHFLLLKSQLLKQLSSGVEAGEVVVAVYSTVLVDRGVKLTSKHTGVGMQTLVVPQQPYFHCALCNKQRLNLENDNCFTAYCMSYIHCSNLCSSLSVSGCKFRVTDISSFYPFHSRYSFTNYIRQLQQWELKYFTPRIYSAYEKYVFQCVIVSLFWPRKKLTGHCATGDIFMINHEISEIWHYM